MPTPIFEIWMTQDGDNNIVVVNLEDELYIEVASKPLQTIIEHTINGYRNSVITHPHTKEKNLSKLNNDIEHFKLLLARLENAKIEISNLE